MAVRLQLFVALSSPHRQSLDRYRPAVTESAVQGADISACGRHRPLRLPCHRRVSRDPLRPPLAAREPGSSDDGIFVSAARRLYAAERDPRGLDALQAQRERLSAAVSATMDVLENETLSVEQWQLGDMCAAILPGYCEFRFPDRDWREGRPNLPKFVKRTESLAVFRENPHQG
ncbi:uncharacterized protein BDZ99DRAFT_566302 [Mytilinidion resinicola]|uniref:Uncharacterized protein n=1 Tax=Mytilinidion resinicola TaxID=574789 RepID=A0A6A6Z8F3_9PEZI|nr:uncharacterized protein BDZ99DRAFT_566302 [Mytilinidion resinicola]KAF2816477.1 hypothetical protein BDZ99DRAFT_566302 [Mytilinidion resinicola]